MWISTIGGRPPRSQHMTGLDQERVDWLHEQLAAMVEWDAPTGRPRAVPLYTAIVMVLFALRNNLLSSLSRGNQQKVVLARWPQRIPSLLLLDEPTQGVDVMSRVDIYTAVREAAGRDSAVLLASSDASELLALCDRIVILRQGRTDQELVAEGLDPDVLSRKLLRSRAATPTAPDTPLEEG